MLPASRGRRPDLAGGPALRSAVEAAVRRWWRGDTGIAGHVLSASALPFELCFRAVTLGQAAARRRGFSKARRAPLPVVSVGNLTVGGAGKTPFVGWLVRVLADAGCRPAVAMRDYGGDESLLHARWNPGVGVHTHRDRLRAARAAATEGANVVVLDDGFQHLRLARDLNLVLLAAEHCFPGPMLPRGPYREPPAALRRADWIIVTRRVASVASAALVEAVARSMAPHAQFARAQLVPRGWQDLEGQPADAPPGDVLAVAGIADPEAFSSLLRRLLEGSVELLPYTDHHRYGLSDIERIARRTAGRTVVVTEKDAVKLCTHARALPDVRVLALGVELERGACELESDVLRATGKALPANAR